MGIGSLPPHEGRAVAAGVGYRARFETAILTGTPLLSALLWAAVAGRRARTVDALSAIPVQPLSRHAR
jgi:hypothetical protein